MSDCPHTYKQARSIVLRFIKKDGKLFKRLKITLECIACETVLKTKYKNVEVKD